MMAVKMGKESMSSQAVGGAVGHNPISIIIPCHRVVGANGSLTGYAGGLGIKIKLLELEGVDMSGLFVPKKGMTHIMFRLITENKKDFLPLFSSIMHSKHFCIPEIKLA
jgi:O-6-methylguanine DNA methyltransferase